MMKEKQEFEWHMNALLRWGGGPYGLHCVLSKNGFLNAYSKLSTLG